MQKVIRGHVYFDRIDEFTGTIKALSFVPMDGMDDMELVHFDPHYLIPFMEPKIDISNYIVVFSEDGEAELQRIEVKASLDKYEETFRIVGPADDDTVLDFTIDPSGSGRISTSMRVIPYQREAQVMFFITAHGEPNILIKQYRFSYNQILDNTAIVSHLPKGTPQTDYSIWAVVPGPKTPVGWTIIDA